jgi:hypothetical protein
MEPMAAAPGVVVCHSTLASPELALVDAVLAAELRRTLAPIDDMRLPPLGSAEEPRTAIEVVEAAAIEDIEELLYPADDDAPVLPDLDESRDELSEPVIAAEDILEVIDKTVEREPEPRSHFPSLPAATQEAIEHMDAALREIRERLTRQSPASGRKFGRLRRRSSLAG